MREDISKLEGVIILKVIAAPLKSNEINISGFDGSIENSGLVDAYHRDYSTPYAGPLMQIKILIRG